MSERQRKSLLGFVRSKLTPGAVSELLWVCFGQVATLLVGFAVIKLLTQMGPAPFGEYTLTLSIAALLGSILYGPVEQGFIRFYYHYLALRRSGELVRWMYSFLVRSGGALLLLALLGGGAVLLTGRRRLALVIITSGVLILALKADEFFNTALNIIRRRKENYLLQGLHKIAVAALLYLLYRTGRLELLRAMVAMAAATLGAVLVKYLNYARHLPRGGEASPRREDRAEMTGQLRGYVLPFLIWGATGWLQLNCEKWILGELLSVAEVGMYGVMLNVVNVLLVIPNGMMMEYLSPIVFGHFADLDNREELQVGQSYIRLSICAVAGLTTFAMVATHFLGAWLIVLISSRAYAGFATLLPLLVLGTGMFYVGQAMCSLGMALNQPARYLPPKLAMGLLSVISNFLFISRWGVRGIAYSSLAVGSVYVIYVGIINRRISRDLAGGALRSTPPRITDEAAS